MKVWLSVTSRAQAVPQIRIAQRSILAPFHRWILDCVCSTTFMVTSMFRQHAEMVKESLRCSYALRATTPCAGKAAVREKACGHHGRAQRPGGIGKNRSPSSCRRWHPLILAAADLRGRDAGRDAGKAERRAGWAGLGLDRAGSRAASTGVKRLRT